MCEFKKLLSRHMEENIFKYLFIMCLFATGVVFGFLFSGNISQELSGSVGGEVEGFLNGFSTGVIDKTEVFKTALLKDIRFLFLILISGFSLWLLPLSLGTILSFGFSIGFTVSYMASNFGGRGLSVTLISLVFTLLINIPLYIVLTVIALNNSINKKHMRNEGNVVTYVGIFILFFGVSMISVVADSFLIPNLIKLICG